MSNEFNTVDIWVANFPSDEAAESYFDSNFITEDDEICQFANDQGIDDFDPNFFEFGFHRATNKFQKLAEDHSYAESYSDDAAKAFKKSGVRTANTIALLFGGEVQSPQSITSDTFQLTYLGRFEVDLDKCPAPYSLFLLLNGREIFFDEYMRSIVGIDPRGLCIGRKSEDPQVPLLDISSEVPEAADVQVKVFRDEFNQWAIEDFGGNGLTLLDGNPLNKQRSIPRQGRKLSIGPIQFICSYRPKL